MLVLCAWRNPYVNLSWMMIEAASPLNVQREFKRKCEEECEVWGHYKMKSKIRDQRKMGRTPTWELPENAELLS